MWIFTKYGFYSAVCARQGDGRHGQPVDPDRIMVRARDRAHLEALIAKFPEQLGLSEIKAFPGTDYAYRIFVPKAAWSRVLSALGDDLDYDNFKTAVGNHQGYNDYEHSLHKVWQIMYDLQEQSKVL